MWMLTCRSDLALRLFSNSLSSSTLHSSSFLSTFFTFSTLASFASQSESTWSSLSEKMCESSVLVDVLSSIFTLVFWIQKIKKFQILWTFRNSTKKQKIYNGTHRSESHQEQLREISTRSAQTNWQKNNKYYDFSKTCRAVQVRCKTTQIRRGTRGGSFFRRSDKERSVRYAYLESTLPGGLEVTHIRINGCWKEGFISFSTQGLDDNLYVVLQGSSMFKKRTMRSTRDRLCKESKTTVNKGVHESFEW